MPFPAVQILFNDRLLQVVPLVKAKTSIGRMRENDIVIDNLSVSRFHASLLVEGEHVFLEDHDSENGCFVNGERIRKVEITQQDHIIIGKHRLVLTEIQDSAVEGVDEASERGSSPWDASSTYAVDAATQQRILESIQKKHDEKLGVSQPLLDIFTQDGERETRAWDKATLTIGRALDNDIIFTHPQVSRRHAVLQRIAGTFEVQDLDTGNGTYVNGQRRAKHVLRPGDIITIGSEKIIFRPDPNDPNAETRDAPTPEAAPEPEQIFDPDTHEKPTVEVSPLAGSPEPQVTDDVASVELPRDLPATDAVVAEMSMFQGLPRAPEPAQSIGGVLQLELQIDLSTLAEPAREAIKTLAESPSAIPAEIRFKIKG